MDDKSDRDMVTKSASSKNAVVTKESIRLLKLLSSAAKNTCLIERGDACLHLVASNRKVLFEEQILKHCLAHGLISLTQSSISLTEIGSAYLKRQLFPNTAFQAQHSEFIHKTLSRPDGSDTVLLNTSESPILRLHTRKNAKGEAWLGDKEFQAGERLRSDFEKAQMQPRISANWVSTVSNKTNHQNSSANLSDFALDCRNRVNAAINSLDSELAGVCLDICCYLKGLELVEKERGWPPRSAKLMLRTALRQLARHYGLTTVNRHSKVAAWGMEGYRPSV